MLRLPTSAPGASSPQLREYLRRAVNYDHMDLEYTFWQMFYLCTGPSRVYNTTKLHKQTKNQWARDDPAFVVVLLGMVTVATLAYSVAFRVSTAGQIVRLLLSAMVVDFVGLGVVTATLGWAVANKWLRVAPRAHNIEQAVEWLYCFDVHCNSYFPLFLVLYPLQFFLVPLLLKPVFLATLLANSIYCGAYCYYWYITFLGYQVLPFLDTPKTVVFLYPCVVVLASYILLLVTRNNLTIVILTQYFGTEDPTMA